MAETFGGYFAELRRKAGYGLRQFCTKVEIDPGNLSKIERGKLPPPTAERLEVFANALGLIRGSDEWERLFDLASLTRGEIPQDILGSQILTTQLLGVFHEWRSRGLRDVA
jgi:transcriptional regulator with XRE-family HTH domain